MRILLPIIATAIAAYGVYEYYQKQKPVVLCIDTNAPGYVDFINIDADGNWTAGPIASRNIFGITNGLTNRIGVPKP